MPVEPMKRWEILRLAILFEGGLAVLACLIGWIVGLLPWERLGGGLVEAALGVAASVPMLALLVMCVLLPGRPFRRIRRFIDRVVRPLLGVCTVADLALIAVVAGVGEELLFRGLIQEGLSRWLGLWVGLGLASVVFGLMHPLTPAYTVLATVAGAYLGWVYVTSGSLLVPIIAHALYDFIALVYLLRGAEGNPPQAEPPPAPASVEQEG
jgi:membrane protease YdiL (CAAX protease family)